MFINYLQICYKLILNCANYTKLGSLRPSASRAMLYFIRVGGGILLASCPFLAPTPGVPFGKNFYFLDKIGLFCQKLPPSHFLISKNDKIFLILKNSHQVIFRLQPKLFHIYLLASKQYTYR